MALTANAQMTRFNKRLKERMDESGHSLRTFATMTSGLDQPERMHHTNLSEMLRRVNNASFYVQQVLVLLNIMNLDMVALCRDFRDAAHAKTASKLLDFAAALPIDRLETLLVVANFLKVADAARYKLLSPKLKALIA